MNEDITLWGLIDRPISVTEASILWCGKTPPDFFIPENAIKWVINPSEYDAVFPQIAQFFKFKSDRLLITELIVNAIKSSELPAKKWDQYPICVYEYKDFNQDLTTIEIEDLAKWAIKNDLSPTFLKIPINKLRNSEIKPSLQKKKTSTPGHHLLITQIWQQLVDSSETGKFPTYIEVIDNIWKYSTKNYDIEKTNDIWILEDQPNSSDKLIFVNQKSLKDKPMAIKTLKNFLTKLIKNKPKKNI